MEKLSQMKMKIRVAKFKLFTPGLVSLEHYCEHRIHLKNLYFTPGIIGYSFLKVSACS